MYDSFILRWVVIEPIYVAQMDEPVIRWRWRPTELGRWLDAARKRL